MTGIQQLDNFLQTVKGIRKCGTRLLQSVTTVTKWDVTMTQDFKFFWNNFHPKNEEVTKSISFYNRNRKGLI